MHISSPISSLPIFDIFFHYYQTSLVEDDIMKFSNNKESYMCCSRNCPWFSYGCQYSNEDKMLFILGARKHATREQSNAGSFLELRLNKPC